ncbi:S-layer homology domain-containing protein [Candidatus Peregrinibacteria bacterium]|nr:MAG: S-layer homology domain-containing protein [Candidatus Peregrinibacteria bacterium]
MKKNISLALLSLLTLLPSNAFAVEGAFSDLEESSDYYVSTEVLRREGFIEGYSDGTVRIESEMNRAEVAKMVAIFLELDTDSATPGCFTDLESGSWYEDYVCAAKAAGIFNGNPDGTFAPGSNMNHAELSAIVYRLLQHYEIDPILPSDGEAWYSAYMEVSADLNLMPDPLVAPSEDITRGDLFEEFFRSLVAEAVTEDGEDEPIYYDRADRDEFLTEEDHEDLVDQPFFDTRSENTVFEGLEEGLIYCGGVQHTTTRHYATGDAFPSEGDAETTIDADFSFTVDRQDGGSDTEYFFNFLSYSVSADYLEDSQDYTSAGINRIHTTATVDHEAASNEVNEEIYGYVVQNGDLFINYTVPYGDGLMTSYDSATGTEQTVYDHPWPNQTIYTDANEFWSGSTEETRTNESPYAFDEDETVITYEWSISECN